ncbi:MULTISPECIES: hypothetical protein [unclassified Arthrobacter]|uniref:hypothetical protein n=1 Tax=unclassified Arthrobacter TaxID=235627 RepID=UPI001CFF7B0C|nr:MULTISPECIES: hypothetical protein [unclassified Arthrobacter]MCB5282784.1 hypothetical protein [Arthrobacter sp. ES1]WGZ79030.1 hypothetical protein QI450_14395 [Arthrobacter sp. EM1]
MNQKIRNGQTKDAYWLLLSFFFAAGVVVIGLAEGLILLGAAIALVVAIVGLTALHGQFRKDVLRHISTASPGVGVTAATVVAVAVLLRGTDSAVWAVPLLAVGASVGLYMWLRRHGRYDESAAV